MKTVRALIQLARPDTSLLAFLAIFIPLYVRFDNLLMSFQRAIPVLFAAMCTFIINDLDDLERDRINHPNRPLPSGLVNPAVVATTYFSCLALSLLTTRHFVTGGEISFLYYLLLIVGVSYSYVVEYLPGLKSTYVAVTASIPIAIVAAHFPAERKFWLIAASNTLFNLGKELCQDVRDRSGDLPSFWHKIEPDRLLAGALAVQGIALTFLFPIVQSMSGMLVYLAMLLSQAVAWHRWRSSRGPNSMISAMKATTFFGLLFLI